MNQITVGERHVGIDHSYHKFGALDCGHRAVHRGAKADIAVSIRKGDIDQSGPKRDYSPSVQSLTLAQMDGNIVCIACVHIGPDIGAHEEALLEEYAFVTGLAVRSRPFRMEMVEVQVGHITGICPAAEGLNQTMRDAGHAAQVHMAVRGDMAHRLIGTDEMYVFHSGLILYICAQNYEKKLCIQGKNNWRLSESFWM